MSELDIAIIFLMAFVLSVLVCTVYEVFVREEDIDHDDD